MSRSLGWTLLTTRSPMEMVPEVMFSSPASIRNRVDLPQPEGPTRTTKAPSSIGIDTPCKTSKPPNDFRTSRICTDDIHIPPSRFRRRTTSARYRSAFSVDLRADAKNPDRMDIVRSLDGFGNCSLSNDLVALSTIPCLRNHL